MTNATQTEDWSARNPLTKITRSPSPSNTFPGNRLPGSSGSTSAPAPAQAATQAAPELSGQHPLISGIPASNAGAGRAAIASSAVEPATQQPAVAVTAPAASNPMTNWNRTGMSNAQVAQANPGGRVTMTRQANGTMAFSGGDVSGPVSYMNSSGNPLVGGGVRGDSFSRVDSAPAGGNVVMGPNGSFAFANGNPLVSSAGLSAPSPATGQQPAYGIQTGATASPAASGAVDAALSSTVQRGDFDAVRAHYAGRGQDFGGQGAQGQSVPTFEAPLVRHSSNDWATRNNLRNLEVSASSITNRPEWQSGSSASVWGSRQSKSASDPDGKIGRFNAALNADMAAQGKEPELQLKTSEANAELQRASMQEQGANQRQLSQLLLKQQDDNRTSAYQAAQLDFSQQRLDLERERAGRDGLPQGYRRTADGQGLEPIRGGPADPQGKTTLNDVQSKSLQFGARMLQSGQILDQLAAEGVTQPGLIKRAADTVGVGALLNWSQSAGQQQVEQAQRNYVNAGMRRESGAAISNSEFDNARKQYFPQPGDSAQVIEQKRRNRDLATQGILAEVPNQQSRVQQVLGAAGQSQAGGQSAQRTVVRTGTANGRKVLQYNDGSIGYAD